MNQQIRFKFLSYICILVHLAVFLHSGLDGGFSYGIGKDELFTGLLNISIIIINLLVFNSNHRNKFNWILVSSITLVVVNFVLKNTVTHGDDYCTIMLVSSICYTTFIIFWFKNKAGSYSDENTIDIDIERLQKELKLKRLKKQISEIDDVE